MIGKLWFCIKNIIDIYSILAVNLAQSNVKCLGRQARPTSMLNYQFWVCKTLAQGWAKGSWVKGIIGSFNNRLIRWLFVTKKFCPSEVCALPQGVSIRELVPQSTRGEILLPITQILIYHMGLISIELLSINLIPSCIF